MTGTDQKKPFDKMQYAKAATQLKVARSNLFLLVIFTSLNVFLVSIGGTFYMLFSATIPYFFAQLGAELCGFMPEEYYAEYGVVAEEFLPVPFFIICLCVALVLIAAYLLCAILSKKHTAGFIVALVLFSIDTVAMFVLYGISPDMILDLIFHIWVMVYLVMGIIYSIKYNKLSKEAEIVAAQEREAINNLDPSERYTSPVLRDADMSVKSRVLAETNTDGHHICYRRAKKVNELVIDGKVYADVTLKFIEGPHTLSATIDGHKIVAGYDGHSSFIVVDDLVAVSKVRLV